MYGTLRLHFQEKIATVTLNRPEKRNAISHELISEILAVLDEVLKSPAQVLIFAAEGKAFCAGMDLGELQALATRTPEENQRDSERIALLFRSIYEFPKITIAAVNGPAIAGGCGIATLCDFTLASTAASFGYTEVRIGFLPAVVSAFLIRQVGEKHARDLLLTGRIIKADEAHRMGLVNAVVEPTTLTEAAQRLAEQLMENSPASLRATKRLMNDYAKASLDRDIHAGMEANAAIRTSADFREGLAAFLEKRKPNWSE